MINVMVTGASGFIGRALLKQLGCDARFHVRGAVRRPMSDLLDCVDQVLVGDGEGGTDWRPAVTGADVIVHAAARVHMLADSSSDPLAEFRRVNVEGTLRLARLAAAAGAKRFVFLSSIGVNGTATGDSPFRETDTPAPSTPYAASKDEAERGLRSFAAESQLEVIIIRPPLVFGPDAPGNFGRLLRVVSRELPLPLGSVRNLRSFLALENLTDFIVTCTTADVAAGQTFVLSDDHDISTSMLIRLLAEGMGRRARLFPCPTTALRVMAGIAGRHEMYQQLCGSLRIDVSKAKSMLNWIPPINVEDALRRTGREFAAPNS